MQIIIISGPSGSGKTTLAKIIFKKFKDGIILKTDNYYKTGIISKILSKTITSYFDRKISFNYKLFKKDIDFILKNGFSKFSYEYNFKTKSVKKTYKETKNIRYIILEGIFIQEILNFWPSNNYILIKLKINKKSCMKRVIKRDYKERGKSKNLAKRDFLKAWKIFYKEKKKNKSRNCNKKFIARNKGEIKSMLKKLTKILH